jgi:DNA polymerase I-like protein with 3'-5' exonuclease and polymerase domains
MIDSQDDYKTFLKECSNDDLFLHLVLTDDREHACTESPSILFVVNCRTEKTYYFSINHQDASKVIEWTELIFDIEKLNGRKFVLDKKSFLQHGKINQNLFDINLFLHLKNEKLINCLDFETNAHRFIRQNYFSYPLHNKIVPLMKHKEKATTIFHQISKFINLSIFRDKSYLRINNEIIPVLSELESHGIFVNDECFKKHFDAKTHNSYVYSQYNLYTSTGRPSNRFGGVNYSALKKDDGSRSCFVSRFGEDGILMMADYSAFHPHIICELTNFDLSGDVDFYAYIAKLSFKKDELDELDIKEAKSLTFRQLYGGIEKEYSQIKFFHNLKNFIDSHWKEYQQKGYTTTPLFGRKIKDVLDVNPSKLFNYILQATETEIAVPILGKVNDFLKNKKSKAILYTYDSILFDINKNELEDVKNKIVSIMKDGNRFPVKCYVGNSYNSLKQISL